MLAVIVLLSLVAAAIGWRRAARRGGRTADRLQYAAAHGIPAFLIALVLAVAAANLGWIG